MVLATKANVPASAVEVDASVAPIVTNRSIASVSAVSAGAVSTVSAMIWVDRAMCGIIKRFDVAVAVRKYANIHREVHVTESG